MSELNVGTLNVGTTAFTGDNTTQTTGINSLSDVPGVHSNVMSAANGQALVFDGSNYAAASMGGRLLGMNVYTSQKWAFGTLNLLLEVVEHGQNLLDVIM